MVSALEEGKRVLEGMRAVASIPRAYCVIAGDGPLRSEVDRLAADLLEGRFLRGVFAHESMPTLYRSADVFLHTAIGESFGNVYIEALASGTPIVAHDYEITRWILEDKARLVDATSLPLVVEALTNALRESRAQAVHRAAFATSRYSWRTIAKKYCDFFAEVLRREHSMA
jgi:glycosyltransferase involved in cell wall biosynthesis